MIAIDPMAHDHVISFAWIKTLVTDKSIEYAVSSVLFSANLVMLATKSMVITLIRYKTHIKVIKGVILHSSNRLKKNSYFIFLLTFVSNCLFDPHLCSIFFKKGHGLQKVHLSSRCHGNKDHFAKMLYKMKEL